MKRTNTAVWEEKHNRWKINVQKNGLRRSFYSSVPGRNGQREANRKADAWLDDGVEISKLRTSVFLDEYLNIKQNTTSNANYSKEKYFVECYIRPSIGTKKAASLTDNDFQNILYNAFRQEKNGKVRELSKKTMQGLRATMASIAKLLRKKKVVSLFPDDWEIPKGARAKGKNVLQPNDISTLFSSSKTTLRGVVTEDPFIHAYRLLVLTGIRPGELKGITPPAARKAVKDGILHLSGAVNVRGEHTMGKNENAVRSVVLSSFAVKELSHQLQMLPDDGSLFGIYSNDVFYNHWRRYCAHNGIEYVSPYELRHTFVSVVKTMPEGEVKSIVGHSQDMDTFGVYGHALNGEDKQTTEKLDAIFGRLIGQ